VADIKLTTHESRRAALDAERALIETATPRYNVVHHPEPLPPTQRGWNPPTPTRSLPTEALTRLAELGEKQRQALVDATRATEQRDAEIRAAVADGASFREVAKVVGVSHTVVSFVVRGRPKK
jgi:hypothetical protein